MRENEAFLLKMKIQQILSTFILIELNFIRCKSVSIDAEGHAFVWPI